MILDSDHEMFRRKLRERVREMSVAAVRAWRDAARLDHDGKRRDALAAWAVEYGDRLLHDSTALLAQCEALQNDLAATRANLRASRIEVGARQREQHSLGASFEAQSIDLGDEVSARVRAEAERDRWAARVRVLERRLDLVRDVALGVVVPEDGAP